MNVSTALPEQQLNAFPVIGLALLDSQYQTTASAYVFVASSAILIWDILDNMKNDYALLSNYRIRLPTIAYFLSRFSSLAYLLLSTIFQTAQIIHCERYQKAMGWMFTIAISSTTLLFTIRVCAIYGGNKYIAAFFGLLWLGVIGGGLTTIHGDSVKKVGSTGYCINTHFEGYATSSVIAPLINDTLVFLAISWRLMQITLLRDGYKLRIQEMVVGRRMPPFSRALFNDGQIYYLTTITTNISTLIPMLIESLPDGYRIMLAGPNVMLMNVMACRVFRKTKFAPLTYCTKQSALSGPNIAMASMNHRNEDRMPSDVLSKFRAHRPEGNCNITIDLSTGERGLERSTELPKNSTSLDSAERGSYHVP